MKRYAVIIDGHNTIGHFDHYRNARQRAREYSGMGTCQIIDHFERIEGLSLLVEKWKANGVSPQTICSRIEQAGIKRKRNKQRRVS